MWKVILIIFDVVEREVLGEKLMKERKKGLQHFSSLPSIGILLYKTTP